MINCSEEHKRKLVLNFGVRVLVKKRSKGLKFSLTRVSSCYLSNAGCSPCTININTYPFK